MASELGGHALPWTAWWEWTDADQARLESLPWDTLAPAVAQRFVGRLVEVPLFARIVHAHTRPAALAPLVAQYLRGLVAPPGDETRLQALHRVGSRHVRLGVPSDWFIGAFGLLTQEALREVREARSEMDAARPALLETVVKRMAIDLMALTAVQTTFFTFHDSLTEVPNRLATEMQLQAYLRQQQPFALVLADLDGFKAVNDTFGHAVGDEVLKAVAQRWSKTLRRTDWVGRWGGDEFLLILAGIHNAADLPGLMRKFRAAIEPPITVQGITVRVSATLGVARYPHDGEAAADLLGQADRALYRAKGSNRGWAAAERLEQETGVAEEWALVLRDALKAGRIHAFFQPIVDLRSGRVRGFEALMRYIDEVGTVHLPGEFLPFVHQQELVRALDGVILRQALDALNEWRGRGWSGFISVNVATQAVTDPLWLSIVSSVRAVYPSLPASALHFEVLESAPLADFEAVAAVAARIAQAGYRLSLDDFGTGYSSLAHVHRLPIHSVKIDHSFLRDWQSPAGRAVIQAIVGMSHPLGVEVVAEGVEEGEQSDALRAWGCDAAQGWWFSPPLPREEVPALLARTWQ
ncbi:MAG: EAL domain-containing protein [Firmicutes bacterium]|nr:EAL domain-containing protein [Alicyclobacillaceae bacterium]MCL6497835.1 EAL domain-containing protein [Bacillota bacterium]